MSGEKIELPQKKFNKGQIYGGLLFAATILLFFTEIISAQNPQNWTSKQLIEPSDLAAILRNGKSIPIIFSVGPTATIPNSVDIEWPRISPISIN